MRSLRLLLFVPLLLLACADGAATDPDPTTAAARQAIVGGATSTTAQDAAVMIVMNGEAGCTGTLIAPNLVLTAHHCVAGDIAETSECGPVLNEQPASTFSIAVGVNADASKPVARGTKVTLPPTKTLCGWDVALIQLDKDIPNAKIARVRFERLAVGETTFAVGYGSATANGPPAKTRRQRQTTVEAVGPATKVWNAKSGQAIDYQVPEGDIATGESTCFGDSGGPLFDAQGNVVGVTSRGIDGECLDRPSVYASVAMHAELIQNAAKAAGHPLDALTRDAAPESADEGDPGDEPAASEDDGTVAPRSANAYRAQASAGCDLAAAHASPSPSLLATVALAGAACFRKRRKTK